MAERTLSGTGCFSSLVPLFVHALRYGDRDTQRRAVQALAAIGPDAAPAVPALIHPIEDGYLEVERVQALGGIGPGAALAVPWLIEVMERRGHQASVGAMYAAEVLGDIGDPSAIPALIKVAADQGSEGAVVFALRALRFFGEAAPDAVPRLLRLLENPRCLAPISVIETLDYVGYAGPPPWEALLAYLRKDLEGHERENAARCLYNLAANSQPPLPPEVRDVLSGLREDPSPRVREWADMTWRVIESWDTT